MRLYMVKIKRDFIILNVNTQILWEMRMQEKPKVTQYEMHKRRNRLIEQRIEEKISVMPIGAKIYSQALSTSMGKIKSRAPVEISQMKYFLRSRDDLKHHKDHYIKIK